MCKVIDFSKLKLYPLHSSSEDLREQCRQLVESEWGYDFRTNLLEKSCDELPTSLVYTDTSENPHKVVGHAFVEKLWSKANALYVNLGKFILLKVVSINLVLIYHKL